MFSQYSWGDFIKFILALAVPYYAYVLIKYYGEDIREWISNRGQPQPEPSLQDADEEELLPVFTVTDYSKAGQGQSTNANVLPPAEWLAPPDTTTQMPAQQDQPTSEAEEVELQGPEVDLRPEAALGMSVLIHADNPSEQSIDAVIDAASRLTADEHGQLSPVEPSDEPAARLASVINNQQGRAAFSDISFSR